jgi:sirohydrochlorin ferrochelatase
VRDAPDSSPPLPRDARISNPKSHAWDHVGSQFWELGRPSARPDAATIARFLDGFDAGAAVLIVGASTRDLVVAAVRRGAEVTVVDFSRRMCDDLAAALRGLPVGILLADITDDCSHVGRHRFAGVLSDRLVNRFTVEELGRALRSMTRLARSGHEIRFTVKHGFYPMDLRLLELGRSDGTVNRFYDERSHTIDYPSAAHLLEQALVPHGDIPRAVLLPWYLGRGKETRYFPGDVERLVERLPGLSRWTSEPVGTHGDCLLYVLETAAGTRRADQ